MVRAIADLDRLIVSTKVSKVVMPVIVPPDRYSLIGSGVFATDDTGNVGDLKQRPALLVGHRTELDARDANRLYAVRCLRDLSPARTNAATARPGRTD